MRKYPHVLLVGCPVDSPLYGGVQRFAKAHTWQLMLEEDAAALSGDWRGEGVIVASIGASLRRALVGLRQRGVPTVCLSALGAGGGVPCVASDDLAIGELAARHYLERCFRHFAWFSHDWTAAHALRECGFRATCSTGGGSYRAWTWRAHAPAAAIRDAHALTAWLEREILAAPKPLGVFCASDLDAMLIINACRIRRLALPDDVSILGVGDHAAICERECVTLSSVKLDEDRIGFAGAELLQRLMAGRRAEGSVLVPPLGIVDRQSTDVLGTDNPVLKTALNYIHAHLNRAFGAAQLAADLRLDRNRLDRLFAAELGRSVGDEIMRQRLVRVKVLLKDTPLRLGAICRQTGFCNPSYLIKCFQEVTASTPLAWRRRHAVGRVSE